MAEMTEALGKKAISPIRHVTTYDISKLESAMVTFSKGLHIGKYVVTFRDPQSLLRVSRPSPSLDQLHNHSRLSDTTIGASGRI
jgi:hypothetical protein